MRVTIASDFGEINACHAQFVAPHVRKSFAYGAYERDPPVPPSGPSPPSSPLQAHAPAPSLLSFPPSRAVEPVCIERHVLHNFTTAPSFVLGASQAHQSSPILRPRTWTTNWFRPCVHSTGSIAPVLSCTRLRGILGGCQTRTATKKVGARSTCRRPTTVRQPFSIQYSFEPTWPPPPTHPLLFLRVLFTLRVKR